MFRRSLIPLVALAVATSSHASAMVVADSKHPTAKTTPHVSAAEMHLRIGDTYEKHGQFDKADIARRIRPFRSTRASSSDLYASMAASLTIRIDEVHTVSCRSGILSRLSYRSPAREERTLTRGSGWRLGG